MIKFLCEKYIEKHKKYSVFNVFWCTHVLNKNLPGQFWILKIEHEMCYKSHLASIFSNRAFFNSRLHAAIFLKAIYNFVMEILKALLPVNSYFCLPRYEVQLYLPRYKRLENIQRVFPRARYWSDFAEAEHRRAFDSVVLADYAFNLFLSGWLLKWELGKLEEWEMNSPKTKVSRFNAKSDAEQEIEN